MFKLVNVLKAKLEIVLVESRICHLIIASEKKGITAKLNLSASKFFFLFFASPYYLYFRNMEKHLISETDILTGAITSTATHAFLTTMDCKWLRNRAHRSWLHIWNKVFMTLLFPLQKPHLCETSDCASFIKTRSMKHVQCGRFSSSVSSRLCSITT